MAERDQIRPLAPTRDRPNSSDEDDTTLQHHPQNFHHHHRRKFMKGYCICPLASLLLLSITIIVLIFTIFRVKDPIITMNGIKFTKLELVNSIGVTNKSGVNMSLIADVSVKNPNVASFRYSNTTTTLYYHGIIVGEARGPPGKAKARSTIRMNITVDVITDRIISSPELRTELGSGALVMGSFSRVPGQVKILRLIKKHVVVKMNCTIMFNISTQAIQEQDCKRKVKF